MSNRYDQPDQPSDRAAADRDPAREVRDVRSDAGPRDRSAHRRHAWLYEDLLN